MAANNEDAFEQEARAALEGEGFKVQRLARRPTPTADFFVSDDADSYKVEVRSKKMDHFLPKIVAEARERGVAHGSRTPKYENRWDNIIREKAKQIAATPERAFRVLWISVPHGDWAWVYQQLLRTLYGLARVFAWRGSGERPTTHVCFYYHLFTFYRVRDLDAVVVSNGTGRRLLVNDLSPCAAEFRRTKLYGMFREHMTDPGVIPPDCGILFVDPSVDRGADRSQWNYLRERYGLQTWESHESEFRAVISFADLFHNDIEAPSGSSESSPGSTEPP